MNFAINTSLDSVSTGFTQGLPTSLVKANVFVDTYSLPAPAAIVIAADTETVLELDYTIINSFNPTKYILGYVPATGVWQHESCLGVFAIGMQINYTATLGAGVVEVDLRLALADGTVLQSYPIVKVDGTDVSGSVNASFTINGPTDPLVTQGFKLLAYSLTGVTFNSVDVQIQTTAVV
jgi:hypothetical protein